MGMEAKDIYPAVIEYAVGVVGIGVSYWWVAKTTIRKVYQKTQSLVKKRLLLALFLLIPTWDIFLGFPVYLYLCKTQSGIKVYPGDNRVEGFYIGERQRFNQEDFSLVPYRGAHFIDYKVKNNHDNNYTYYRDSWVDANTTEQCRPVNSAIFRNEDFQLYRHGKCIVHSEIQENAVSPYAYDTVQLPKILRKLDALHIQINSVQYITDNRNKKTVAEVVEVSWNGGWVFNLLNLRPVEEDRICRCPDFEEKMKIDEIFIPQVVHAFSLKK